MPGMTLREVVHAHIPTLNAESTVRDAVDKMDVYQFLVRRQGYDVSNRGWFVYANGDSRAGQFADTLRFTTTMVPYDGDDAWVLGAFRRAVAVVEGGVVPAAGEDCQYCAYVGQASAVEP